MLIRILGIVLIWLCFYSATAQIKGRVVDKTSEKPLSGAHIVSESESLISDENGFFQLNDRTIRIEISFLGYQSRKVQLTDSSHFVLIQLEPQFIETQSVTIKAALNEFPISQVPSSIGYLKNLDELNLQSISYVNYLSQIPGINAASGTFNTNRITIRGVGSRTPYGTNRIKAYYHNIPLTTGDGTTEIEDISTSNIGNIEVLKGSKSALYGSGLGGVLVLNPPKIQRGSHGNMGFGLASFNSIILNAQYAYQNNHFYIRGGLNRSQSDGWRQNNQYKRTNAHLSAGFEKNKSKLDFIMMMIETNAQIPSSINKPMFENNPNSAAPNWLAVNGFEDYIKIISGISYQHTFNSKITNTTSLFTHIYQGYESRPFNILDDQSLKWGFRNKTVFFLNQLKIQVGLEALFDQYNWEIYETNEGNKGALESRFSETRRPISLFLNGQYRFSNQTIIEAGISLNSLTYSLNDQLKHEGDLSGNYQYDIILSPFLGINIPLNTFFNLYSSISHGFSAPSVEETLLPEGSINLSLKPETGLNTELGIRFNKADKLFFDACVYSIWIDNLLVTKRETEDIFYGDNAGKTWHRGLELSSRFRLNSLNSPNPIHVNINYHYIKAIFTNYIDDGIDYTRNQLPGIPNQNLWFSASIHTKTGFYAEPQLVFVGEQYLNDANSEMYQNYYLLHLNTAYKKKFKKMKIQLSFGIKNILNYSYASMVLVNAPSFGGNLPRYYYPGMPRNFYISLRLEF